MRKRILVLLVAVVMALTMVAAPVSAHPYHSGSYHHDSYYKNGPFCHWYGHGYKVVWGKSHYYHGDYRAKKYYDYYGDLYYSCRYLYDHGGFGGFGLTASASVGFGY
jgi:hypothetical protein